VIEHEARQGEGVVKNGGFSVTYFLDGPMVQAQDVSTPHAMYKLLVTGAVRSENWPCGHLGHIRVIVTTFKCHD